MLFFHSSIALLGSSRVNATWMASYEYLLPTAVFESLESTQQTDLGIPVAVA